MSLASTSSPLVDTATIRDRRSLPALYFQLTKARLSALVLLTAAAGFILASPSGSEGGIDWRQFCWTMLGIALAAGSANALNQVIERRRDRLMHRTAQRPIPSGRMSAGHALVFGLALGYLGVLILALLVNLQAAALAFVNIVAYVLVYTPLKPRTTLNTLVGAVCGALPPMIGWVGASGVMHAGAWILAAILFFWQLPHFLALAWLYREDYARGGFRMLPIIDQQGLLTSRISLLCAAALVPIGLLATLVGLAGAATAAASVGLGLFLVIKSAQLCVQRSQAAARSLFIASLLYLSILMPIMIADRGQVDFRTEIASDVAHVTLRPSVPASESTPAPTPGKP